MTSHLSVAHQSWLLSRYRLIVAVAALTACDDSVQGPRTQARGPIDVTPYITESALSSLGPNGQFAIEPAAREPFSQISPEVARTQAVAAVRAFGPALRGHLESGYGGPIDLGSLRVSRVYYANSAYEQTIPTDVVLPVRKYMGPYYMVVLSQNDQPAISVAVSAYNTNIQVNSNGELKYLTVDQGHDFRLKGIPRGADALPVSPERAVQLVAAAAGVRVAGAPRLQLATPRQIPQAAWWRIQLERSVSVRDPQSGLSRSVAEVVVGPDRRVLVGLTAGVGRRERVVDPVTKRSFEVAVREWVPVSFFAMTSAR